MGHAAKHLRDLKSFELMSKAKNFTNTVQQDRMMHEIISKQEHRRLANLSGNQQSDVVLRQGSIEKNSQVAPKPNSVNIMDKLETFKRDKERFLHELTQNSQKSCGDKANYANNEIDPSIKDERLYAGR